MLDSEEELHDPSTEKVRRSWDARRMMVQLVSSGHSWSGRERNVCFLNTAGPRFANVSATSGLDFRDDGRAAASVDWDADGDLDLWLSNRSAPRLRFLRNDAPGGGRSVSLRLAGNGTSANRDAIGARVELVDAEEGGPPLVRTLRAGEGFLTQSTKWLHFGVGDAQGPFEARVRWPDGVAETFSDLAPGSHLVLEQGTGRARPWQLSLIHI